MVNTNEIGVMNLKPNFVEITEIDESIPRTEATSIVNINSISKAKYFTDEYGNSGLDIWYQGYKNEDNFEDEDATRLWNSIKAQIGLRPIIVCLCGSTKFKEEFAETNKRLTMQGKIVLSVGCFGHADGISLSQMAKDALDELHLRKIDLADEVVVISVDGYIGESTRREIEYAKSILKPVIYWDFKEGAGVANESAG